MNTRAQILTPTRKTQRVTRSPEHPFYIQATPFTIAPFHIQPVLPGETMSSLLWRFRAITQPLRSQIVGWWAETYLFYVKLSQLDTPEAWVGAPASAMLTDVNYNASGLANAALSAAYHEDTASINYVKRCRDVVVRHWFRDEGEDETTAAGLWADGQPLVQMKRPGWMDSIIATAAIPTAPSLPADAANATMRELERLQQQWEMMNAMGITQMTYEDFVKTWGVSLPNGVAQKRPELLRYERYWQLPGTAVGSVTSGTPEVSSVVSWKADGRADKDRLFKEHGFIVGYMVFRPKMYLGTQRTSGVSMLNSAFAWAPKMFDDQWAGITVRDYADQSGPLYDTNGGYTVDTKDLFLYGDQFIGNAVQGTTTDMPTWTLPTSLNSNGKYPITADVEGLMADTSSPAVSVKVDGVVNTTIKTNLIDTSPQSVGRVVL